MKLLLLLFIDGQSHGDFLGGDILYSGNVSLLFPLPNDIDIRFYVSAGNLFNWTSKDKNSIYLI